MNYFGSISYSVGAVCFLVATLVLLTGRRDRPQKRFLAIAAAASAAWSAGSAYYAVFGTQSWVVYLLEIARDLAWLAFLLHVLGITASDVRHGSRSARLGTRGIYALAAFLMAALAWRYAEPGKILWGGVDPLSAGLLVAPIVGLVLIEQALRNMRPEAFRSAKYLCLGIGAIFAYDFFLYANALLFRRVDVPLWDARGIINAMAVPVMAVGIMRDPRWSFDIFVSRRIVFHTSALVGAAVYLFAMGVGGYYVRYYGGTWGVAAQAIFLFGAVLLLSILLFSVRVRARLRVLINKHFFRYKYDYREEWLRFIRTLSTDDPGSVLHQRSIRALAQIIDGSGGVLFMSRHNGYFEPVAEWNIPEPVMAREPEDGAFVRFLEDREWVVNLDEDGEVPPPAAFETLRHLEIPEWLRAVPQAWLVVPLILESTLLGFVVLTRSVAGHRHFNWEDCDLLKTAGRQAASHLAQCEASRALAESRQFETFNRLSAYVVHDLKNLVAQLSLVVSNAARHKNNPLFMQDAVQTVENSVAKMNRLLAHLRGAGTSAQQKSTVDLQQLLADVSQSHAGGRPVPRLESGLQDTAVLADRDRLASVIGHIIQNAQDATPEDGRIVLRAQKNGKYVIVEVEDTGCGMDERFLRERLFRPFDTTKGDAGMGIGAYEAREFVRALGGDVDVQSQPGKGTTFRIQLPYHHADHSVDLVRYRSGTR